MYQTKRKLFSPKTSLLIAISFAIASLILCFSLFIYLRSSAGKYIKVELVSGQASIKNGQETTKLKKAEIAEFKKSQNLEIQKDSLVAIIFANGKVQSLNGPANLVFKDFVYEGNEIKYTLVNQNTGEKIEHKEIYGLAETTAVVLGFNRSLLFGKQSKTQESGQVLGVRESKYTDQEKREKFELLYSCMSRLNAEKESTYVSNMEKCLKQIDVKSLSEIQ